MVGDEEDPTVAGFAAAVTSTSHAVVQVHTLILFPEPLAPSNETTPSV